MQYFIAGPLGAGMLAALPVIIAHAFGNLPFRGWLEPAILGVLVLVVARWAGPIYRYRG